MTHNTPANSTTTRLAELEHAVAQGARRERRWRWALIVTASGLGLAALSAATDVTRIDAIRTHRLEVLNADGDVVMSIGSDERGGRLDLWSPQGANLARLASNDHGGDLALWNETGGAAVGVWATEDGGTLAAWTATGGRGATIAAGLNGGTVSLGMSMKEVRVSLQGGDEAGLDVRDATGIDRTTMRAGSLVMTGLEPNASLALSADIAGPSMSLIGEDGYTLTAAAGRLTVGNTDAAADLRPNAIAVGDPEKPIQLRADADVGEFRVGEQAMRLSPLGEWSIQSGPHMVLQAGTVDGIASLQLNSPGGLVTLQAGPESKLDLVGTDTESVTLASGPDSPILQTSDFAIRMHANAGAGSLRLGGGEAGGVRLSGGVDGMRPAVDVLAPGDVRVATLSTGRDGLGLLAVSDASGTPVAILHGLKPGHGRLAVHGSNGLAIADSARDGSPSFSLQSLDGQTIAAIAATPRGGALNLMNADGTPVVLAGVTADGPGGAAAFQNGEGHTVVAAGSTAENVGRIVIEDSPTP